MKSTERASQSVAREIVKIDRVLGVEGGQIQHGGLVAQIRGAFFKSIVINYGRYFH